MLSLGINVKKVDFNRKTILVYHIADDVTGKPTPICGAKIDSLSDSPDIDYILANLDKPDFDFPSDEEDIFCSRCKKVQLSPGSDEAKSRRRLARFTQKKRRHELVKFYEKKIFEELLGECPKCKNKLIVEEPYGNSSVSAACDHCKLRWDFLISAKHTGSFVVWVHDESRTQDGKAEGFVTDKKLEWIWREPFVPRKRQLSQKAFRISRAS